MRTQSQLQRDRDRINRVVVPMNLHGRDQLLMRSMMMLAEKDPESFTLLLADWRKYNADMARLPQAGHFDADRQYVESMHENQAALCVQGGGL